MYLVNMSHTEPWKPRGCVGGLPTAVVYLLLLATEKRMADLCPRPYGPEIMKIVALSSARSRLSLDLRPATRSYLSSYECGSSVINQRLLERCRQ